MDKCVDTLEYVHGMYPTYVSAKKALEHGQDPLNMFTTPIFDGILGNLEPYDSMQTTSTENAVAFNSTFPNTWSSSPYPGMSATDYMFLRNRANPNSLGDDEDSSPVIYGSNTLWGSRSNAAGPWIIPGVPPASQSKYVTNQMFTEAAGYPSSCSMK